MFNRKSTLYFPLAITVLLFTGCASNQYVKLAPVDNGAQKIVVSQGKKTLVSEKNYYVSLVPYQSLNNVAENTFYRLYVDNLTNQAVRISSKNVQVTLKAKSADGTVVNQEIAVLSPKDLMLELHQQAQQRSRSTEWVKSTAISADNLHNTQESEDSNTGSAFEGNPFAAADEQETEIQAETAKRQLKNISKKQQNQLNFIKKQVMKARTIAPGQAHGGLIITDTHSLGYQTEGIFEIIVSVGKEQHTFLINRSPYIDKK